jgi:hypothetical protein
MNRKLLALMVGLLGILVSQSAQAALATWDFTTAATGPLSGYTPSSGGLGNLSGATLSTSGGQITPNVAGGVLDYAYQGNHAAYLNNCVILLALTASSGFNYNGMSVAFQDTHSGGLTAVNGQWSYRVTTPGYTDVGSSINLITTAAPNTSLTGVSLSAGQTLYLQFTMSSGAGSPPNGSLTFDNLVFDGTVTPVPEPVNVALGLFGGLFGVVLVARSRPVRARIQHWRSAAVRWVDAV